MGPSPRPRVVGIVDAVLVIRRRHNCQSLGSAGEAYEAQEQRLYRHTERLLNSQQILKAVSGIKSSEAARLHKDSSCQVSPARSPVILDLALSAQSGKSVCAISCA